MASRPRGVGVCCLNDRTMTAFGRSPTLNGHVADTPMSKCCQVCHTDLHRFLVGDAEPVRGPLVAMANQLDVGAGGTQPPALVRDINARDQNHAAHPACMEIAIGARGGWSGASLRALPHLLPRGAERTVESAVFHPAPGPAPGSRSN
jgi:hypothetical protein